MTTKIRHLYPTSELPSPLARSGREPSDGIPLGWLESLVQTLRAALPTEEERNSILVFGSEHLSARYTDVLTPEEQMRDELTELRKLRDDLKTALPPPGETMPADVVAAIRQRLG